MKTDILATSIYISKKTDNLFYGDTGALTYRLWRCGLLVLRGTEGAGLVAIFVSIAARFALPFQFKLGCRSEIGSSANLMEHRSFQQVPPATVLNISNIRHKRDNCRKQQILLLLLCCLNGSLKESRC